MNKLQQIISNANELDRAIERQGVQLPLDTAKLIRQLTTNIRYFANEVAESVREFAEVTAGPKPE